MRPAITGDAKALLHATHMARDASTVESRVGWLVHGLLIAIDLPEPEPTAKADEEQDYTCPICGENTLDPNGRCQCGVWSSLAAANRRIKELERERDDSQQWLSDRLQSERDSAYAKGAEDFRESVAKMLRREAALEHFNSETTIAYVVDRLASRVDNLDHKSEDTKQEHRLDATYRRWRGIPHPIPKPKETQE